MPEWSLILRAVVRGAPVIAIRVLLAGAFSAIAALPPGPPAPIGVWVHSSPDQTDVVLHLGATVRYNTGQLSNPERFYPVLPDTFISPSLPQLKIPAEDALVEQVRLGRAI